MCSRSCLSARLYDDNAACHGWLAGWLAARGDRSIVTEIYLCHACSCQEILRVVCAHPRARGELSATHFTVVGNLCKIATVVFNILIWDRHASGAGLGALLLCLGAGYAYSAAPMRADFPKGKVA
jgi:hypothetical protein